MVIRNSTTGLFALSGLVCFLFLTTPASAGGVFCALDDVEAGASYYGRIDAVDVYTIEQSINPLVCRLCEHSGSGSMYTIFGLNKCPSTDTEFAIGITRSTEVAAAAAAVPALFTLGITFLLGALVSIGVLQLRKRESLHSSLHPAIARGRPV